MQKDDNCIFKNTEDRWGMSYLSKHLLYASWSHLVASPVKLKTQKCVTRQQRMG